MFKYQSNFVGGTLILVIFVIFSRSCMTGLPRGHLLIFMMISLFYIFLKTTLIIKGVGVHMEFFDSIVLDLKIFELANER